MKKLIEKDKKRRKIIQKYEKTLLIFKMIRNNRNLPFIVRFNALKHINHIERNASKTFLSNRCVKTINKKKFHNRTHYSRIFFLKLAKNNRIYGLTKSSW